MPKIVCISDTHSYHREIKIPDADIIICAGDITFKGELDVIEDFADWMGNLPIKHKITIFGNHSIGTEDGYKRPFAIQALKNAGIHYLEDSGTIIEGLNIWGSPVQPFFNNWEWNRQRGADIKKHWDLIPDNTNILITHGPPKGILDLTPGNFYHNGENVGCEDLLNRINELKELKLSVFGHIHSGAGTLIQNGITFVNACCCTEQYQPTNPPIVIDL